MPPARLPNALIYLSSLLRPRLLRPDLFVPTIANVDFRRLRQEKGFNAVVVDKDNCVTVPNEDGVYPPFKDAWKDLVAAFPPGRVLVVSNSAGTRKDPGAIAAEAVSYSLRTPVLLHTQPKPGCAPSILSYFRGELGEPTTLRSRIRAQAQKEIAEEKEDERMLLDKWRSAVEGPILGPLVDENGEPVRPRERSEFGGHRNGEGDQEGGQRHMPDVPRRRGDAEVTLRKGRDDVPKDKAGGDREIIEAIGQNAVESSQPLKIIVLGDRLFTDTLLAHRLRLHMSRDASSQDVISIATTQLPRPNDVRLVRWIENVLSRRRVREGPLDWGRYILRQEPGTAVAREGLRARIWRRLVPVWLREPAPMTRDPRSWPVPILLGTARGMVRTVTFILRCTAVGVRWLWARAKRRIEQRKAGAKAAVVAPEVEQTKAKIA
ncbi:hypothetical protein JCM24511_00828 [Saitozyma sp. JCM 24511]|nr:hypothetical protein JCM24511_00828 [Saitozyma sp. JCM 24511]